MRLFQRLLTPKTIGLLAFSLIRLIHSMVKYEWRNREILDSNVSPDKGAIFAFWHQDLIATSYFGGKHNKTNQIHIMASLSRDGEIISHFLRRCGFGIVRGSSSRRGGEGLRKLLEVLKNEKSVAIAVDGPRGPLHKVKPGVILLAKKSAKPIIPFAIHCTKKFSFNSWDRCELPLPFSTSTITFANPIYVPSDASTEIIKERANELEKTLLDLKQANLK